MKKTSEDTTVQKNVKEIEKQKEKEILYNAAILRMIPDNIAAALAKARTKPIWCSDIRWRMELSRRKRRYTY